jgi:serine protease
VPASLPGVIGVAATNRRGVAADFSNRGPYIDVAAPGEAVITTGSTDAGSNPYISSYGTSIAAPHVAGVVSLVWSADPLLTRQQVVSRVLDGAADKGPLGRDDRYGHGLLDAKCSVAPGSSKGC